MMYKNLNLTGLKKLAVSLTRPRNKSGGRVLGLVGQLGAGKTTFIKAMAESLGVTDAKSPTFTIVHRYEARGKSLYHIDLYRLEKDSELGAIGLDEIIEQEDSIVAIEWVDKFPKLMKKCDAIIKFEITKDQKRNVTITRN